MGQRVLFVSPHSEDARRLTRMLEGLVALDHADTLAQARKLLVKGSYRAVLTESELPDGEWTDILRVVHVLAPSAEVMLTDRLADVALWTEALDRGCFDLIAQPFDESEVQRIVSTAACSRAFAA